MAGADVVNAKKSNKAVMRRPRSYAIHLIDRNYSPPQTLFGKERARLSGPSVIFDGGVVMMKSLAVLATAGVIAVSSIAAPAPAQAGNEGAVAAGVIGGLAAGAIIGSAARPHYGYGYGYAPGYTYYGGPYAYSRCYTVRKKVWTNHGPRWRRVRVCD
jgi:hypothetical protein